MAGTIGTAYIQIEPSTQGLEGSISSALTGDVTKAGKTAGGALASALGSAAKIGGVAIAGIGTAFAGVTSNIINGAKATAEYGDSVDKMSQKLGVSSSFYQEWDAVLQHSGTSMDSMSATFKKLATASQDASTEQVAAFEAIGLSMEEVSSMSTEDLFTSVISGLQGMEEGTERTALASQLLGRGAMEMGALLNTSAEDTQSMIDAVNELGGVMSDEGVKNAAAFQDSLQDMQTAFGGIKNKLMSEFLPSITTVMDGLGKIASGDESGIGQLKSGISQFIGNLTSMIPKILEVGGEIVKSLAGAIIDNLPAIIDAAIALIKDFGKGLLENLPAIMESATQIVLQLATSIGEALPELIPAVIDTIMTIVDGLLDNIDLIIDAAIELIVGLAVGLAEAAPKLIEKGPEIIMKIVEGLVRNLPKILAAALEVVLALGQGLVKAAPNLLLQTPLLIASIVKGIIAGIKDIQQAGKDIVSGLWEGIKAQWGKLVENLSGLCSSLVDKVKSMFKIGSPSKIFRDEVGQWIPAGVAVGIEGNMNVLDNSMKTMQSALSPDQLDIATSYATNYDSSSTEDSVFALLSEYLPQLANMQMVTETGAMVGALAPKMDKELGRMASMRSRYV